MNVLKLRLAIMFAMLIFCAGSLYASTPENVDPRSVRAFEELLVPIGSAGSATEDADLVAALGQYQKRAQYEDVSLITTFLGTHPQSRWEFALLANLGTVYGKTGHYSKAIEAWEAAWALGRGQMDSRVQALADHVVTQLATLLSSLGRTERLRSLLTETKGRTVYGSASAGLTMMKENLWLMDNRPGDSFKCGPYALESIQTFADKRNSHDPLIEKAQSSTSGFSLTQVRDLSTALKMNYQMAKRTPGAAFVVPSVIHWKSGHYAALLQKRGDHYLVTDPTFGRPTLLSEQALEDEASGYFLVPSGTLPAGWQAVSDAEGGAVWGRGQVDNRDAGETKPDDKKCDCDQNSKRMAVYNFFAMLVSLNIEDTPVGYTPPVGPDMNLVVTYNQYEADQPSSMAFANFGPSWTCSWLGYARPATGTGGTLILHTRGGGYETYNSGSYVSTGSTYPGYFGYYKNELQSQATVWVSNGDPSSYERRLPDGSKEVYGLYDAASNGSYVFLTAIIDPQGNSATFGYDANFRLTTVTDALGLQTNLSYGLSPSPADPSNPLTYLVTKVTDPYGRSAAFGYTSSAPYELQLITDVIGIQSSFTYGNGSVITKMTTPYGSTTFNATQGSGESPSRTVSAVEPDGSNQYAESQIDGSHYPYTNNPEPVPSGYVFTGYYLQYRNTYYWGKKAMQVTGNNPDSAYTEAYIYHFLHSLQGQESGVLESEKPALENRIWYSYPNQSSGILTVGSSANPTVVARVLSDGTTQATQYQYNNTANPAAVTAVIDPLMRQTNYVYDSATGLDLQSVTQTTGSSTDTLLTVAYDNTHNPPHCPHTVTDAANQITTYAYNGQGQVTSVTPPLRAGQNAEPTVYGYTKNFLTSIAKPLSGAVTTIVPDTSMNGVTINRPASVSDPESYKLQYAYDSLDRVTKITYPDTTTQTFSYTDPTTEVMYLDLIDSTDRLNRKTHRVYDATRHLTSITDPLQQKTQYGWCACGALESLTDPAGHVTTFMRDVEARVTSKVYQDQTHTDYVYDTATSRVCTKTDARGNVSTYSYNLDDTVSGIAYTVASGTAATASDAYTYETNYKRLSTANGVSMTYVPAGMMGAMRPYTVINTLTKGTATVTYGYDEWGRVNSRGIDNNNNSADANTEAIVYDSLGRQISVGNNLGSFGYSYFDPTHPTSRLGQISFPNGQGTTFNYFGNMGDERLQEIKNMNSAGAVISQHDYTYDAFGRILTWQRQIDSNTPLLWTIGYDAADQLKSVVETNTTIPSPATMQYAYNYDASGNNWDPSGNSPSEQIGTVTRTNSFDSKGMNQLTKSTVSGNQTVRFTGLLYGANAVTINGTAATTNSTSFSGAVTLSPGTTNTVTVVASDAQNNTQTSHYQTAVAAVPSYQPAYDADGNQTTDGATQSYTWDAKNQLVTIAYTDGNQTTFGYNGRGQRTSIVETGSAPSTKQFVWDGMSLAEERDASNNVTKRFFAQGEQIAGQSYFYTRDHLGSVHELVDGSQTVRGRYSYDPYGVCSANLITSNAVEADFGFTGHYVHQASGLHLASYRAYNAQIGRWISRDPIGEKGGLNLYGYVRDNPISYSDPFGLAPSDRTWGLPKRFWRWYHRQCKESGDPDLDKDEADEYYKEWKELGEPGPDSKGQHSSGESEGASSPEPTPAPETPTADPSSDPDSGLSTTEKTGVFFLGADIGAGIVIAIFAPEFLPVYIMAQ